MGSIKTQPINVFVVAPRLIGWAIEQVIEDARPHLVPAGSAGGFAPALEAMERRRADVAVTLLRDQDAELLADFCAKSSAKILAVTDAADEARLDAAVRSGVRGILGLGDSPGALVRAIDTVHGGELWIDRGTTSRIFLRMAKQRAEECDHHSSNIAKLTLRERQTVAVVARHVSAPGKVLADKLCISEHTLRNHLSSIYSKLGLSSRLALYAYATTHNLCAPE